MKFLKDFTADSSMTDADALEFGYILNERMANRYEVIKKDS